jgi:stringent starvation protein B
MSQHRRPPRGPEGDGASENFATRQATKQAQVIAALEDGQTKIHLDARQPGVEVPADYAQDYSLTLNLSWRFSKSEMKVDDSGVCATLHFAGKAFRCVIPWPAIWGMLPAGTDALHVWTLDLPPELGGARLEGQQLAPAPAKPQLPRLQLVASSPAPEKSEEPPAVAEEDPAPVEEDRPKAPWLRLVR